MSTTLYQVQNRIAYITLNRPEKRNALSYELVAELKEAFQKAEDDTEVKVVVLKAEGKAFCAGADLGYLQSLQTNTYEENLADSRHLKELFEKIYYLPKVVIAQVQGHALAGGCGLATVCDLVYSVPEAKFGYTEVKIGFIPAIVKVFLLRKIGESKAKQLLLTGDLISAEEAKDMGMVNYVVAHEELSSQVNQMAEKLCLQNSAQSMGTTKLMIARVQEMPVNEALEYAAEMNAKGRATDDCKKGIAAFLNKEDLTW